MDCSGFQLVRWGGENWRYKTKRLHWFNFGLHLRGGSLHGGLRGEWNRFALVYIAVDGGGMAD